MMRGSAISGGPFPPQQRITQGFLGLAKRAPGVSASSDAAAQRCAEDSFNPYPVLHAVLFHTSEISGSICTICIHFEFPWRSWRAFSVPRVFLAFLAPGRSVVSALCSLLHLPAVEYNVEMEDNSTRDHMNLLNCHTTIWQLARTQRNEASLEVCEGSKPWKEPVSEAADLPAGSPAPVQMPTQKAAGTITCQACNIAVAVADKNEHYQSEWHVCNVRRKAANQAPLSKEEFENGKKDDEDDSDVSADDNDEESSASSAGHDSDAEAAQEAQDKAMRGSALVTFRFAANSERHLQFDLFKAVLAPPSRMAQLSRQELVNCCQEGFRSLPSKTTSCVLLISGGRFAGALFRENQVVQHKSFQRYTTRRKQGGSQSAHDQQRHAKSAGASIRRHHEGEATS